MENTDIENIKRCNELKLLTKKLKLYVYNQVKLNRNPNNKYHIDNIKKLYSNNLEKMLDDKMKNLTVKAKKCKRIDTLKDGNKLNQKIEKLTKNIEDLKKTMEIKLFDDIEKLVFGQKSRKKNRHSRRYRKSLKK